MSEAEAVAALVAEQKMAEILVHEGTPILITRSDDGGTTAQSVKPFADNYLKRPERKIGTARLMDLGSFVQHIQREKSEYSMVFMDPTAPRMVAVYNYQEPGAGQPDYRDHRALYEFPLSDEWQAWSGWDKYVSQQEFAEFLEDHLTDVIDPSLIQNRDDIAKLEEATGGKVATPGELLTISRGLNVTATKKYQTHQVLSSGETQFTFEEAHTSSSKTGGPITIPTCFAIAIPLFKSGALYIIPVKLRYRIAHGGVVWTVTLYKPEKRMEDALAEAAKHVCEQTGLEVLYGVSE